jgi:hypothetical protein
MSEEDTRTKRDEHATPQGSAPLGVATPHDEAERLWGRYVDTQTKKDAVAEKVRVSWLVVGFALGFFVLLAGLAIVALG